MVDVQRIDDYRAALLRDLERLVNMDSFSRDKQDVDRVGVELRQLLQESCATIETHRSADHGDSLIASLEGTGSIRIMMLGHMDTVHPRGTAARLPYRVEGDIAYGPGTEDMKAAILMGCYTMRLLRDVGYQAFGRLSLLINADEEIGSPSSRAFIEEQARKHDVVLVLEGPQTRREIVSRRKGSAKYELTVQGRAAHAGVEPELGRNALVEMAHQIIALQELNTPETGTTVNVCMAEGGVASNVIPALAKATIDVRVLDAAEAERIVGAINAQVARTTVPDVECILTGGFSRPPMEKTEASAKLIALAQHYAEEIGFSLREITMGGGTDGNFTAAIGIPTLDGMGPDGGRSHSEREFLELPSIWERMAVLLRIIDHLSTRDL